MIMPLVWGLRALMTVENGMVRWRTDPKAFIEAHLGDIARSVPVHSSETPSFAYAAIGIRPI